MSLDLPERGANELLMFLTKLINKKTKVANNANINTMEIPIYTFSAFLMFKAILPNKYPT